MLCYVMYVCINFVWMEKFPNGPAKNIAVKTKIDPTCFFAKKCFGVRTFDPAWYLQHVGTRIIHFRVFAPSWTYECPICGGMEEGYQIVPGPCRGGGFGKKNGHKKSMACRKGFEMQERWSVEVREVHQRIGKCCLRCQ